MARPLRLEYPGALWHITNRGVEQRDIYADDADRQVFVDLLATVVPLYRWRLHHHCLMTNHFHLLSQTLEPTLSRGMQQLEGDYADYFNRRHGRSGHLFKGRFDAQLVDSESYLLTVARYIVLNPVRARIVKLPDEWGWSSYRAAAGLTTIPAWLDPDLIHERFDSWDRREAAVLYRKFVLEGIGQTESPWDHLVSGLYLGSSAFIERVKKITEERKFGAEHLKRQKMFAAVDFEHVRATAETYFGVVMTSRGWRTELPRLAFALAAREQSIASLSAIGNVLSLTQSGVSRLVKRAKALRAESTEFRGHMTALETRLNGTRI